jgi:acyl-coenzyme A thioesterase PaaI-like protein
MNLWPPYVGAGIRVLAISEDFRDILVEMPLRRLNRNPSGAHFGGSLYAMTDPFFAIMVTHNLPRGYVVWDSSACIEFVSPGRGRVSAQFRLGQADLDAILKMTANGEKHLHLFKVDVIDGEGLTVARVEKLVYVRRARELR